MKPYSIKITIYLLLFSLSGIVPAAEREKNFLNAAQLKAALKSPNAETRLEAMEWNDFERWQEHATVLLKDKSPAIRAEAALHLCMPFFDESRLKLMDELSNDADIQVRAMIGIRACAPPQLLDRLVSQKQWPINKYVAYNSFAPSDVLDKIADQLPQLVKSGYTDGFFSDNSSTSEKITEAINDTRNKLLENPNTKSETIRKIYLKGIPFLLEADMWFDSANVPADLLVKLALKYAYSSSEDSPKQLAFWKKINAKQKSHPPEKLLAEMLDGPIYYLRSAAASSMYTPTEALTKYYKRGMMGDDTIDYLARNPATDIVIKIDMLKQLPSNKVSSAMHAMMIQPWLQPEILEEIIKRCNRDKKKESDLSLYYDQAKEMLRMQKIVKSYQN